LRHIVLGAMALAGAAWFLDRTPVWPASRLYRREPMPKERQSETGAHLRRVDRAEDMIALLHEGNQMEIEGARLATGERAGRAGEELRSAVNKEHQRCDKQLMDYADQKQFDHRKLRGREARGDDGPLERLVCGNRRTSTARSSWRWCGNTAR